MPLGGIVFAGLGHFIARYPWHIITVWGLVTIVLSIVSPPWAAVVSQDEADFLPRKYESVRASELAKNSFPDSETSSTVMVFERRDAAVLRERDRGSVVRVIDALAQAKVKQVKAVVPGELSEDGQLMMGTLLLDVPADSPEASEAISELRKKAEPAVADTNLKLGFTGPSARQLDIDNGFRAAEKSAAIALVVFVSCALLLIFRSVAIASIPCMVAVPTFVVIQSVVVLLAEKFGLHADNSLWTILLVTTLSVIAVYSLFLLFVYREGLRAGGDSCRALVAALGRMAKMSGITAGTVMMAGLVLLAADMKNMHTLGVGLAVALAVLTLAFITLTPALIAVWGQRLWCPGTLLRRSIRHFTIVDGALTRYPRSVALLAMLLLLALTAGMWGLSLQQRSSDEIPRNAESTWASSKLRQSFSGGVADPAMVLITTSARVEEDIAEALARDLSRAPGVDRVRPTQRLGMPAYSSLNVDGTVVEISLVLNENLDSMPAWRELHAFVGDAAAARVPGSKVLVGGSAARDADIHTANIHDMKRIFPILGAVVVLLLGLGLRSLTAPWGLCAVVAVCCGATLGAANWVFAGRGQQMSHELPLVGCVLMLIVIIPVVSWVVDSLRQEVRGGYHLADATARVSRSCRSLLCAAGFVCAAGFSALLFVDVAPLTQLGVFMVLGALLATVVSGLMLVPMSVALWGSLLWWPDRITPRVPWIPPFQALHTDLADKVLLGSSHSATSKNVVVMSAAKPGHAPKLD